MVKCFNRVHVIFAPNQQILFTYVSIISFGPAEPYSVGIGSFSLSIPSVSPVIPFLCVFSHIFLSVCVFLSVTSGQGSQAFLLQSKPACLTQPCLAQLRHWKRLHTFLNKSISRLQQYQYTSNSSNLHLYMQSETWRRHSVATLQLGTRQQSC